MSSNIRQLKPPEEAFTKVYMEAKKADAIIICEGKTEVEILKAIIRKLNPMLKGYVLVTDAEGIDMAKELIKIFVSIRKLVRKIKVIGLIIDAEDLKPETRFKSIIDSIKSINIRVVESRNVCKQVFSFKIDHLIFYISVSGIEGYGIKMNIENHIEMLKSLGVQINSNKPEIIAKIIEETDDKKIRKAFYHIICLLYNFKKILDR